MPTLTTDYQRIGTSTYTVVGSNELRLYAKHNGQDIANNKTSVTVRLTTIALSGSFTSSGNYSELNCGGDRGRQYYDIGTVTTGSEKEIGTWTFDLYHNDNGTYSGSASAGANVYGSITPWVGGSFDLPTIARASQPSATSGNIEENIVIYTNRKSPSFTHTLTYAFATLSGTIATGVGDSITWTLPSEFYTQIPADRSGWGIITCTTYNGSTNIGSKTCRFDVYTSETRCRPTIALEVTDTNEECTDLTGSNKRLIKFFSNARATLTGNSKNSAWISKTSIACGDGKSANDTASFTTSFNGVESAYFKGSITDSRGYSNSVEATGLSIVDYIKLTINPIEIYRPIQTGSQIKIKGSGNYFNGNFGNVDNTLTFKYIYREYGESTWSNYVIVTPTISDNTYSFDVSVGNNFDYRKQYEFMFIANDKLMEVSLQETSKPGIPLMWLGKNYMELDGKKAFDWEDDNLRTNEDIYIGETDIQLKNLTVNIETDGNPVKSGRIIDGKYEYVKRIDCGYLLNHGEKQINSGLDFDEIFITKVEGMAKSSSANVYITIPNSSPDNFTYDIALYFKDNYILIATGSDRTSYNAYVDIYFTYND